MQLSTAPVERPRHVPPELVRDVDFYNLPGGTEDVHVAWKRMAEENPPLFWTPRNGGHWIATRPDDILELQVNYVDFSMAAVQIPRGSTPALPVESDPPYHTGLRAAISPLFRPEVLKAVEGRARALMQELITDFATRGECEFGSEFARHVPIAMFLYLVDLPLRDKDFLLELAERRFRSPDARLRDQAKAEILNYLRDVIEARRAHPGQDFISKILHAPIGDRPINDFEAENMLATVMSGGLDTVSSLMGFVMRYIAMHPEHRRRLIEEPAIIPRAVDEFIRRHGITNTGRLITRDLDFHGVRLKEGEQIMGPNMLVGLSEEKFDRPFEVDFDRPNSGRHAAFGNGPHRCPGANLGRLEVRLMLEEWLARIPDFRLDEKRPPVMKTGLANSILSMHLVWDS